MVEKMIEYAEDNKTACKWDKDGYPVAYKVTANPLVINNMFFKPIVSIGSIEPMYSPEKLSLVFDYYCDLIAEVNDKIGDFPSSLTSFCRFAGITFTYLRKLRNMYVKEIENTYYYCSNSNGYGSYSCCDS